MKSKPQVSKRLKRACAIFIIVTLSIPLYIANCHFGLYAVNIIPERFDGSNFLSVMTFNVNAYDSTKFTPSLQKGLLKLIEQEQPDILCFQELSFESLTKIKPQLDSIYGPCEVLNGGDNMWRLRFYSHYPIRSFNRHKCVGNIDINDLTDIDTVYISQAQKQMNVMSAEFEIEPGKWVTVFSGHLRSSAYSTARRSMRKDANWFEGISLYKKNYEVGKRIRDYEAENVRRFVNDTRKDEIPVIIAGDLNDWCGSDCLNTLMGDDLKDAWWEGGNGFGWTYFGWHLRLRLDHILYSDELELVGVKVIDTDISDHKPLMAKFRFRN